MNKKNLFCSISLGVFTLLSAHNIYSQQGNIDIQQNEKIEKLMEVKTEMNRSNKIGDRYVIQLFYGDNGEANDVLKEYKELYAYPSNIVYEAPNYKVWVGNFRNRLEADRALLIIKENFPAAFIPKPQRK